jgi:hypothetical protein
MKRYQEVIPLEENEYGVFFAVVVIIKINDEGGALKGLEAAVEPKTLFRLDCISRDANLQTIAQRRSRPNIKHCWELRPSSALAELRSPSGAVLALPPYAS